MGVATQMICIITPRKVERPFLWEALPEQWHLAWMVWDDFHNVFDPRFVLSYRRFGCDASEDPASVNLGTR
jgi:hypothetical protein